MAILRKSCRDTQRSRRDRLHYIEDRKAAPPIVTRKPIGGRVLSAADLAEIVAKHRAGQTLAEAIRSTQPPALP